MDWNTVATRIAEDDCGKWDRRVPARELSVDRHGHLVAPGSGPAPDDYILSELATTQLCERLSIPATYYRRLPAAMRSIVANFDLERLTTRSFLLRGKATRIRALLSAEYVAYDNAHIVETAAALLRTSALTLKTFILEETHCFVTIVSEELCDPASGLKAGIMIGNSEVGLASVSVEPFVFRKACTNDLEGPAGDDGTFGTAREGILTAGPARCWGAGAGGAASHRPAPRCALRSPQIHHGIGMARVLPHLTTELALRLRPIRTKSTIVRDPPHAPSGSVSLSPSISIPPTAYT